MPQNSSNKNLWIVLVSVAVLLLGGYFIFAKTQNLWPFSSHVAVEPSQSVTPTSTPTSQPTISSQGKFYIQTWSDTPQSSPNLEIYEIKDGQSQKIFSRASNQLGGVIGVIPEGLLIVENASDLPTKLSLYNTTTQKWETLVALATGHTFVGSLSPDHSQVVFADYCGIVCNPKQGEARNLIKAVNLTNKAINTIYSDFAANSNSFYFPSAWADNNIVILTPRIEVGEGPQYYQKVLALNIQSKQVKELSLDQNARSFSVESNGAGIVYTTFVYDFTKKTPNSTLVLKSLDGTTRILQSSSQLKYESSVWLDNENIAVLVTAIQSVNEDCAYDVCIEGKRAVQIINTKTGDIQNLTLPVEPVGILFGNKQNLYYLSSIETPNTYLKSTTLLHGYNLARGEDKIIFQSPRFIYLVSQ
jgi:hypothetical protein